MRIYPVIQSIYVESYDMEGVFILLTPLFRFVLKVMSTFAEEKKKQTKKPREPPVASGINFCQQAGLETHPCLLEYR